MHINCETACAVSEIVLLHNFMSFLEPVGTCEASRFEPAILIRFESDGPIQKFLNRPCLPIARRSQTTQTINGA